jgi:hypothetical protein
MIEAQPALAKRAVENRPLAAVWAGAVCPVGTKSVTFMGGGTAGEWGLGKGGSR